MNITKVIFLDDDKSFLNELKQHCESIEKGSTSVRFEFYSTAETLRAKKNILKEANVIVADLRLETFSGLDFLEFARTQNNDAKLILITGQLITEDEQVRLKKIKADFLFKLYGTDILLQNILYFSQIDRKNEEIKHVFISYRRIDYDRGVKRMVESLEKNGISVWIDRESIWPGDDWQIVIKEAIRDGMYFLACFSNNYWNSTKNYMNEELQIAIDELRKMPDDQIWFIPAKLDDCKIPYFEIRQNKTLDSKQFVKLFEDFDRGIERIIRTIKRR